MNRKFSAFISLVGLLAFTTLNNSARADLVHADDVIIQRSLAVGLDAVNGEAFGTDTIRLKQNGLRIHFDDMSVGTFPANDWRIIINDTSNGGANYFGIEDSTAARIPCSTRAPFFSSAEAV